MIQEYLRITRIWPSNRNGRTGFFRADSIRWMKFKLLTGISQGGLQARSGPNPFGDTICKKIMNTRLSHRRLKFLGANGIMSVLLVFAEAAFSQVCQQIGGEWQVEEHSTITYDIGGQISSAQNDGSGPLTIEQDGCQIHFESQGVNPIDGSIIRLSRDGSVNGNNVTYTGEAGVIIPGASYSENYITGTGVIDENTITVNNVGSVRASAYGIPIVVTISGTALFTRSVSAVSLTGEVRLVSPTGEPVSDVTMRLAGNVPTPQETLTDSHGHYAFNDLSVGSYTVVPHKSGFLFEPAGQTVNISQATPLPVFVAHPVSTFQITRIWSDQVPNSEFCSLPPDPSKGQGAGTWGNSQNLIVMGAGADGRGHVSCEIEFDPADSPFRDKLILRLVSIGVPAGDLAEAVWNGDTATFAAEISGSEIFCQIHGWIDFNDNGQIDLDSEESLVRGPGTFVIVSRSGYEGAISQLRSKTWIGLTGIPLPIAYRLLDSFLDNAVPQHATDNGRVPVSAVNDRDHNTGVEFGPATVASVHEYLFDHSSDVAEKVIASDAVRTAVLQSIEDNRSKIMAAFQNPDTQKFSFPIANSLPIEFQKRNDNSLEQWDLYYAFHSVVLNHPSIIVKRDKPDSVRLSGALTDTYDFRWNVGELSSLACRVQAGFPSLGNAGEVFRVRVLLDGDVPNVRYDQEPSVQLQWGGYSSGTNLVLECTHAPGSNVSIEYSTDLKSWQLLRTLPPAESVATLSLEELIGQYSKCYFRVVE